MNAQRTTPPAADTPAHSAASATTRPSLCGESQGMRMHPARRLRASSIRLLDKASLLLAAYCIAHVGMNVLNTLTGAILP